MKFLLALALSTVCVSALVQAAGLSKIFSPVESIHRLAPGETAVKEFDFTRVQKPQSEIYTVLILVDGDAAIEDAKLEINGHKVEDKLRHLRDFDSTLYLQSFELRSLGYPANIDTDQFRHWRAIAIEPEWLNWKGENELRITGGATPALVYTDPSENRHMLSTKYFSVNSLCNSENSLDLRIPEPITTGDVTTRSQMIDNANRTQQLQDSLRIRIGVVLGQHYHPLQAAQAVQDKTALLQNIPPKKFDLYIQDPTVDGVRANRINLKAARSMGTTIDLPALPSADSLLVKIEGDLRHTPDRAHHNSIKDKSDHSAELVVALQPSQQNSTLVLNLSPAKIPYQDNWTHFVLQDRVPTKLLSKDKQASIYVAVYPGRWLDFCGYPPDKSCGDVQFSHLRYEIGGVSTPDIANKTILFY